MDTHNIKYRVPKNLGMDIEPIRGVLCARVYCHWKPDRMPDEGPPNAISSQPFKEESGMECHQLYTLNIRDDNWVAFFTVLPSKLHEINDKLAKGDLDSVMQAQTFLITLRNSAEMCRTQLDEKYLHSKDGSIQPKDGRLDAPADRKDGWMYDRFLYNFALQEIKKAQAICLQIGRYRLDEPKSWNPIPKVVNYFWSTPKEDSRYHFKDDFRSSSSV